MHYTGWLFDGTTRGAKFDSSVDRGSPFQFPLGLGDDLVGARLHLIDFIFKTSLFNSEDFQFYFYSSIRIRVVARNATFSY